MKFSKAQISRQAFGTDRNWELSTNGYRAHELVWKLFSDREDRKRDFVFRWETEGQLPVLYVVSEREPVDREGLYREVRTKDYDPQIAAGDRFVFQLRANPVVKRRDEDGKQHVHDVVMDAKTRDEDDRYTQSELVQREGYAWLCDAPDDRKSRAERAGFEVAKDDFIAEAYERHEFRKSGSGRRVVIVTLDFRGVLRVNDVDRFKEALFEGIGPSKAFGCGLLMIRPVR